MASPRVSIILPTHNGARFLPSSVQSCIEQTYQDWELIIVDDASTDETPREIEKLLKSEPRIRSFRHETNRKLPGALNTGFSRARGAYLTWTSDDNRYRPSALARMAEFLDARPEVDVVYTNHALIDERGEVVGYRAAGPTRRLVFGNVIGPCFLFRRAVYEKLGDYAEDLYLAEDYDYWLRASSHFRLEPLDEDLYLYRHHSGSLSCRHAVGVARATERCLERNLPNLAWAGNRAIQRRCLRLACEAKRRGELEICRKWFGRAVRIGPLSLLKSAGRLAYLFPTVGPMLYVRSLYRSAADKKRAA